MNEQDVQIIEIENGQKPGTLDLFRRLAGVLNVALDELVGSSFSSETNP